MKVFLAATHVYKDDTLNHWPFQRSHPPNLVGKTPAEALTGKPHARVADQDILVNSQRGIETLVKYGEQVGRKFEKSC
ncbi:hypothetical protein H0A36_15130 [Endozoicomonas sp. SM1973]|uniref:Uncharacterized protein n=1 Tax=Spartinivicinus marinus TaxID=2994442 RepID=A0A853I3Y4_9GAMM|nr:hypothetical protein [Spartinivicinus marinus]MCX4026238.1 hypothetical protein [Spartinivicinus marinus]NYZ67349.1 hypothetical protein [Spartinivicinus marinus]